MERELQIQAVVIAVKPLGEIHKSVTLLSPESGLINAKVYGGRKGKKSSLAPLFSFGTFQIYHNPVKKEYSIEEEDCIFLPDSIMTDLKATYTASYLCEVASKIKTDSPEEIYTLLISALQKLESNVSQFKKIIIDFTWKLIQISGIASDLESCPSCDCKFNEEDKLGFSTSMVTPVCLNCSDRDDIVLLPGVRRYLRHTAEMSFHEALDVELYDTAQIRIKNYLLAWIDVFCQGTLKTLQSGVL